MPQAPHDAAFEREWAALRRKLRLARGFCLIFCFVDDERPALALKSRLRDALTFGTSRLAEIAVEEPSELVSRSLAALFDADEHELRVQLEMWAPCWLEAYRGRGDSARDEARIELLMRLNERRSRLEAEVRRPLVLLLPHGFQREAAGRAPDMWHIRVHSAVLEGGAAGGDAAPTASPQQADRQPGREAAPAGRSPAAGELPREALYWQRQLRRGGAGSRRRKRPHREALSLQDGFVAVDALREHGAVTEALRVAREVLGLARERVPAAAASFRADALRDLSVALERVGDAEAAASWGGAALAA